MESAQRPQENSIQSKDRTFNIYKNQNQDNDYDKLLNQINLLKLDLNKRDQEITDNQIYIAEMKKIFQNTKQTIEVVIPQSPRHVSEKLSSLLQTLKPSLHYQLPSAGFEIQFQKTHPNFYKEIKTDFPTLTRNELKHCAFVKVNLSNKEIAKIINVSPKSVVMAQYRLKKKLKLPANQNLFDFVCTYQ